MKKYLMLAAAAFALTSPVFAQDTPAPEAEPAPSPNQIVDAAPAGDWVSIAAEDLLIMMLAPDRDGNLREVVIQLMPAPFSQGWVSNIRTLVRAGWYDGISVNRVQDNYVVQWGDANVDNPEAEGEAKPLPDGLNRLEQGEYLVDEKSSQFLESRDRFLGLLEDQARRAAAADAGRRRAAEQTRDGSPTVFVAPPSAYIPFVRQDPYALFSAHRKGWAIGLSREGMWPVHCYGMVGVGRGYSPDTGSGAELYTVIGHAPRHLDRNIALVGRVIEGIEHLSSLPRGTGDLGFYETAEERVPIESIRIASELAGKAQPASNSEAVGRKYAFEYLSTESETFARYADARANRRDPFFIVPAGGADICNIPVPVRRVAYQIMAEK